MKMKIDLSQFKLKHKDEHTATLAHPHGHEFKVAIKALHPMNRKNLDEMEKFSEGGDVDPTQEHLLPGDATPNKIEKKVVHGARKQMGIAAGGVRAAEGGKLKAEKLEHPVPKHPVDYEPHRPLEVEKLERPIPKHPVEAEKMAEGGDVADEAPQSAEPVTMDIGNISSPQAPTQGSLQTPEEFKFAEQTSPDPQMVSPQAPAMAPQAPQNAAIPASQAPQAPSSDNTPPPGSIEGYKTQVQAEKKIGEGEAVLQQVKAKEMEAQAKAATSLMDQYQQSMKAQEAERQALIQDIKDGHIDPNHYLGSQDTGSRIATGIALALGGLGAGINGGENQALQFINKQIDNDIEAQKANLGKKHTLLSANLEHTKDMEHAMQLTRLQMNDIAGLQLGAQEAKAQSPIAKARAQMLIGQLQSQMGPVSQQLALKDMLQRAGSSPEAPSASKLGLDPSTLVPQLVPEKHQAEAFKEIKRAQDVRASKDNIMKDMKDTIDFYKSHGGAGRVAGMIREPRSMQSLKLALNTTVQDLTGTTRQAEFDNIAHNALPQPGDTDADFQHRIKALEQYLDNKSSAPTAKGYGIDLDKFASTGHESGPKLSPQQESFAKYAKAHPNDPRSALMLKKLGL